MARLAPPPATASVPLAESQSVSHFSHVHTLRILECFCAKNAHISSATQISRLAARSLFFRICKLPVLR